MPISFDDVSVDLREPAAPAAAAAAPAAAAPAGGPEIEQRIEQMLRVRGEREQRLTTD